MPDLAYTLAAVFSGVPVVNFTRNFVEIPALLDEAVKHGVPVAGRESLEYLRPIFKETGMAIET